MKTIFLDVSSLLIQSVNNSYVVKSEEFVFMFWPFNFSSGFFLTKDKEEKFEEYKNVFKCFPFRSDAPTALFLSHQNVLPDLNF